MNAIEKIDMLCSMLGIRLEFKHMKDSNIYEHMYHAKFLSYGIYCKANPIDFRTIDCAYFFNSLWFNRQLCFNNYELDYVLELLAACRSFKLDCKEKICIGNPFYKKFELIHCKNKDELSIMLDLLNINDMSFKNIYDVKKMLKV